MADQPDLLDRMITYGFRGAVGAGQGREQIVEGAVLPWHLEFVLASRRVQNHVELVLHRYIDTWYRHTTTRTLTLRYS